ncbi:MAG: hypothetical protein FWG42_11290 [Clostridiales bacterium]|nr:hypothetical protein [Clostridiales bacterium]
MNFRKMKKFTSVLLIFGLVLASGVFAFADEGFVASAALQEELEAAGDGGIVELSTGIAVLAAGDALTVPAGVTLIVSGDAGIDVSGGTLRIENGGKFLLDDGGTLTIRNQYAVYVGTNGIPNAVMDISQGTFVNMYTGFFPTVTNQGELYILDGQAIGSLQSYAGAPFVTYANYAAVGDALAQAGEVDRGLYTVGSLAALDAAIGAVEFGITARYYTGGFASDFDNRSAVRAQIAGWAADIAAAVDELELKVAVNMATGKDNILSITENEKSVWTVDFSAFVTYNDGSEGMVAFSAIVPKNGAGTVDLGDFILVYDIKGNGSNVKTFEIVPK